MLKYCLDKWEANKNALREEILESYYEMETYKYEDLVKLVVREIFNRGPNPFCTTWDTNHITTIDNGGYHGTLIFVIPADTYQPEKYEYLFTAVNYGSCSGCDTLLNLQMRMDYEEHPDDDIVNDFLALCKDIVTSTVHPFECMWHADLDERVTWNE